MELEADIVDLELKAEEDDSVEGDGIGYTPSLLHPLWRIFPEGKS